VKLLLDTHCWLWLESDPERFSASVKRRLEAGGTELWLSSASVWELAIKIRLGKLELPEPLEKYVPVRLRRSAIGSLPVRLEHALEIAALPPHHNDPFDRMLIAQARCERLTLLSADRAFDRYDVDLLSAD
jgi:PIN domain nuclease of toxin-antitoxin system